MDKKSIPERRKYPRVMTHNLISYVCMDESGKKHTQGMGRTIDISQGGILLETHSPIESEFILLMGIGLKDEIIDIKGRVAFCRTETEGSYHCGIRFVEKNDRIQAVLFNFIKVFHAQKQDTKKSE